MRVIKKFVCILIILSFALQFAGCRREKEANFQRVYKSVETSLYTDAYVPTVNNVFFDSGKFYVNSSYTDENFEFINTIYVVNESGEVTDTFEIPGDMIVRCISDGKLIATERNRMCKIDLSTGDVVSEGSSEDTILSVSSVEEGIVVVTDGEIILSGNDGLSGTISSDAPDYINNIVNCYEDIGKYYLTENNNICTKYYELDFDAGTCTLCFTTEDYSGSRYMGKYVIDGSRASRINIENMSLEVLSDFDYQNIEPMKGNYNDTYYFCMDDDRFAVCYTYYGGEIGIQFFTFAENKDFSDENILTIGGFNINEDIPLKWAVYKFNGGHEDIRAVTIDYGELFPWNNANDAQAATAALIQYFNEGNSPDIFYGMFFDFRYLYDAGMLSDLMPYMEDTDISSITPEILNLITQNDVCYEIFSSYRLNGYWGKKSVLGDGDVSIYELEAISEEMGILPLESTSPVEVADFLIRYNIDRNITDDELTDAINFSVKYGVGGMGNMTDVGNDLVLTAVGSASSIYGFYEDTIYLREPASFIGYPSFNGSVKLLEPVGLVGMSADTSNPEACWELMSELFSEDVQRIASTNWEIPVNSDVVDELCEAVSSPESLSREDYYYGYVLNREAIPQEFIDGYREAISSVNTIATYDWGIYNIISEELMSYDVMGKESEEIADSLRSRLDLYMSENY